MIIREIKYSDYKEIAQIVLQNDLEIYNYEYWKNLWLGNPYYKTIKKKWTKGWVLEIDNKIVGYLGNFPMLYFFFGIEYVVAVPTCWAVNKNYRKYSILLIQKYFNQKNIDLFFTSTASLTTNLIYNAFKGNDIKFKEYKEDLLFVFNLFKIVKALRIPKKIKFILYFFKPMIEFLNLFIRFYYYLITRRVNKKILVYKSFTNEFDFIWRELKKNCENFILKRNTDWLNWHFKYYIDSNRIFIMVDKIDNKINSYCILIEKINVKLKLRKLCLVDLISLKQNDKDYENLIKHSIRYSKLKKYDYLEIKGFNSDKRKIIKKFLPFVRKFKNSRHCYRTTNIFLKKSFNHPNYLNFSMIDGDAIF